MTDQHRFEKHHLKHKIDRKKALKKKKERYYSYGLFEKITDQ